MHLGIPAFIKNELPHKLGLAILCTGFALSCSTQSYFIAAMILCGIGATFRSMLNATEERLKVEATERLEKEERNDIEKRAVQHPIQPILRFSNQPCITSKTIKPKAISPKTPDTSTNLKEAMGSKTIYSSLPS